MQTIVNLKITDEVHLKEHRMSSDKFELIAP